MLVSDLQHKESQKKKLSTAFSEISSCLSSDEVLVPLKEKVDEVLKIWTDLSGKLSKVRSILAPLVKLAKSFENNRERLLTFLNRALSELTGLSPIPSESEAVHELRLRIDVRGNHVNCNILILTVIY